MNDKQFDSVAALLAAGRQVLEEDELRLEEEARLQRQIAERRESLLAAEVPRALARLGFPPVLRAIAAPVPDWRRQHEPYGPFVVAMEPVEGVRIEVQMLLMMRGDEDVVSYMPFPEGGIRAVATWRYARLKNAPGAEDYFYLPSSELVRLVGLAQLSLESYQEAAAQVVSETS